jgi:hypothetical protein
VDDAVEGSWAEGVRDHVGTGVGIAGGIFADATEPTGVEAPTMHAAVEPPTDLGISTFQLEQPVDQPIDQPVEPVVEAPAPVEAEPIIEAQFDAMDTDAAPMEEQIVDDIFADDGAMAG